MSRSRPAIMWAVVLLGKGGGIVDGTVAYDRKGAVYNFLQGQPLSAWGDNYRAPKGCYRVVRVEIRLVP